MAGKMIRGGTDLHVQIPAEIRNKMFDIASHSHLSLGDVTRLALSYWAAGGYPVSVIDVVNITPAYRQTEPGKLLKEG